MYPSHLTSCFPNREILAHLVIGKQLCAFDPPCCFSPNLFPLSQALLKSGGATIRAVDWGDGTRLSCFVSALSLTRVIEAVLQGVNVFL